MVKGDWFDRTWRDLAIANWSAIGVPNWIFANNDLEFNTMFSELINAIDMDSEHIRLQNYYQNQALDWERVSKNPSFLLIGDEITPAEEWLKSAKEKDPKPSELQANFITQSRIVDNKRIAEAERIAQQARTFRRASAGLGIVAFIAMIATVFAFISSQDANNQNATSVALCEKHASISGLRSSNTR